jgi:hypothetical protein
VVVLVTVGCVLLASAEKGGQGKGPKANDSSLTNGTSNLSIKEIKDQAKEEIKEIKSEIKNQTNESKGEIKKIKTESKEEIKQIIAERRRGMEEEISGLNDTDIKVYRNQNAVREAVHALLAMENRTGGIGRNISAMAREFNNSVRATINAESRIQKRSKLRRILFGGDDEAAGEIEREVGENTKRVKELKQIRNQSALDDEVRAALDGQIKNIEAEETRLTQLAQKEKKSKGLLGWLWKR